MFDNPSDEYLLQGMIQQAAKRGLTVWAYAVHTGSAKLLKMSIMWRAMTDSAFCQDALERAVQAHGNRYLRPT